MLGSGGRVLIALTVAVVDGLGVFVGRLVVKLGTELLELRGELVEEPHRGWWCTEMT